MSIDTIEGRKRYDKPMVNRKVILWKEGKLTGVEEVKNGKSDSPPARSIPRDVAKNVIKMNAQIVTSEKAIVFLYLYKFRVSEYAMRVGLRWRTRSGLGVVNNTNKD